MDGLGDVGGHVEGEVVGQPFGEVLADFRHRLLHVLGHLHGVGTRQHVNAQHGRVAAVDTALGVVRLSDERPASHVTQADKRAVGIGTEHNLLKLGGAGQTSLRRDGDGDVQSRHRLLSQYACRRLAVLVLQGVLHVLHGQAEVGQAGGVYPNLHGIVAAADVGHTTHAGNTTQEVEHIDGGKVTQIDFVELGVIRGQTEGHQLTGGLLLDFDTVLHHLGRQTRLCQFDAVLNFHSGQVGVGGDIERHCSRKATRIGTVGLHVEHARRAVQFLLDGGGHSLRHGQGAGAGIGRADLDHRGRDLRILVYGEHRQADEAHDDNQYGYDGGEYRPVYEKADFHSFVAVEDWDSTSSFFAATRMRMPGVSLW